MFNRLITTLKPVVMAMLERTREMCILALWFVLVCGVVMLLASLATALVQTDDKMWVERVSAIAVTLMVPVTGIGIYYIRQTFEAAAAANKIMQESQRAWVKATGAYVSIRSLPNNGAQTRLLALVFTLHNSGPSSAEVYQVEVRRTQENEISNALSTRMAFPREQQLFMVHGPVIFPIADAPVRRGISPEDFSEFLDVSEAFIARLPVSGEIRPENPHVYPILFEDGVVPQDLNVFFNVEIVYRSRGVLNKTYQLGRAYPAELSALDDGLGSVRWRVEFWPEYQHAE